MAYEQDQIRIVRKYLNKLCTIFLFFWGILSSSDEREELFDNFVATLVVLFSCF